MINQSKESVLVNDGRSTLVILEHLADHPGGLELLLEGFTSDEAVIPAGHLVLRSKTERKFYPAQITAGAYVIPADRTPYGVVVATVLKARPHASVLTVGQVREAACPAPVTDAIRAALPSIRFI